MIGLIAFGLMGFALFIGVQGLKSFYGAAPTRPGGAGVAGFLTLSVTCLILVFVVSAVFLTDPQNDPLSFALVMALANIGAPAVLSVPIRVVRRAGHVISDALRVGAALYVPFWFWFAQPLLKVMGLKS